MEQTRNLDPKVRECIRKRGFAELSEIQSLALPQVQAGKHLILIAPTGTGKTESAMIPVLDALLKGRSAGFSALYITPLRSLNRDMLQRLSWWCTELGITVGVRHGDTTATERRKQALSPPELLITTPETLQALFMGKVLRKHLRNIRYVIVDEIHELAGGKRGAQLTVALERLAEYCGEFQRIGLSATVGNPGEMGRFLCGERDFSVVEVDVSKHLDISVEFAGDSFEKQARWIEEAMDRHGSTLIFVNTRVTAEALGHQLFSRGDVDVHHGSLSREVRIDAEERFKAGQLRGLICTSSMELGIDIGHIEHVIQFGSPREVSRLVQRVGRAGHSLYETSRGTILATGFDDLLESLVIARRAKAGEVEDVHPPLNPADVLANQVAGMAVEYGRISRERIRRIIGRCSTFSMAGDLLDRVCTQMAEHRLIRLDGDEVITTLRARRYLAANLSMIHDERKVQVFDMVSRRTVGTLDESFVVGSVYTGAVFITKGQLWRVLDLEEGRIIVEPARRVKGELPSWEGEQIPVPFAVAREVGELRRTRSFPAYDAGGPSDRFASAFLAEMDRNRSRVPDDRLIMLESGQEGVVCNCCAGHRANEALGRAISVLLSARFGTTVGIEIDAYRILFRLPSHVAAADVRDVLVGLDPAHVEGILQIAMKRTALFKWKLVQIAKKFGAIDPDADYERLSSYRLIELFENTVVQQEAYRELFSVYMDVPAAARVLAQVRDGSIAVEIGRLSILGADGLFSSRDQMPPPLTDQAVLSTLRRRIEGQEIILACMNCRKWKSRTVAGRVQEHPVCPRCGARLIAVLKPWEEPLYAVAAKKEKSGEEKAVEARLFRNANIVLSGGKKAVLTLAAKGVGPEIASRILATLTDGDAFFAEILKAERNYIRTRKYW
ncbi:MAG: DEAD/DEAH box helicase [Methanomicrobiales archaeon]|nr:DEAD/DEAH box helicase [Methanomicrobiales archaeon]NYT20881.1 DEAD/DEAH box helicase [Methanomicrobiales archaeon]